MCRFSWNIVAGLARLWFGDPPPPPPRPIEPDTSTREQVIEKARKLAEERGWTWLNPAEVTADSNEGDPVWVVRTSVWAMGRNVRVVLRRSDHSVVGAGYHPR
jgi:hypothetical protein